MRTPRLRAERVQHRTPPAEQTTAATEQHPAVPAEDDAEQLRAGAHRLRTWIADTTAQAETLVSEARTQAERLLADADARSRALTGEHARGRTLIRELEERAGYLEHAAAVRAQAETAGQQAVELATETTALTVQRGALDDRLAELAAEREDTAAALMTAREAGDVSAVAVARAQMAAVDEVAATLGGRRDTLTSRLQAIGEPGGSGELPAAQARADAARAELRRIENLLNPDRLEARIDYVAGLLTDQITALVAD